MLDFIGTVVTAMVMVFVVSAVIVFMEISRDAKLILAAVLGLWIGVAAAAAVAGMLAISRPFPIIGIFVAAPLVATALATLWPAVRRAMLSLPIRFMIGLNIWRILAVLFLLLWWDGRLAGPFPFFAAGGDIITGAIALILILGARSDHEIANTQTLSWNLFGIADLVLAITLGITSAEGSPLQLIFVPPGSAAMQYAPFSFVPTVLVPFWLILHAIIWVKLGRLKKSSVS